MNFRAILAIVKKELLLYAVTWSNFLVLAGVLLVTTFLFFNNFYTVNVSSLDQLFSLFPWVFALLVPAVTLGVVARERQERTLYYLLSQPITEIEMVVGKFLGGWIFLSIFPLATVIIPIVFGGVATFDMGVLVAGYIAAVLFVGLVFAINLAISTFFTNQLAVFIVSFIANFFLILLGSDVAGNMVPAFVLPYAAGISPMSHYQNLIRGLIEFGDVAYFIAISLAMILIAIWQIRLLRGGAFSKQKLFAGLSVQVLAIVLIVVGYFAFLLPYRIDITAQQVFTLTTGTRNIVGKLTEPVTIAVYLSKNLPPAFQPTVDDITRIVGELKALKSDKIEVTYRYPDENQDAATEAQTLGIQPQSFSVVSQTEYSAKQGYLGINVKYQEQDRTIPVVNQTADLEYQLVSRIYDLTSGDKPVVAYLKNEGSTLDSSAQSFFETLASSYTVKTISVTAKTPLKDSDLQGVKVLLLGEIDTDLSMADQAVLTQAVSQGTSLLVFENGVTIDLNSLSATKRETIPVNTLLANYGIMINPDITFDEQNANIITFSTGQGNVMAPYAFWPNVKVEQVSPILKDFSTITTQWASSLTLSNEKAVPLLKTSRFGGSATENFDLSPERIFTGDTKEQIVGAYVAGSDTVGGLAVFGSTYLINDQFVSRNSLVFANIVVDLLAQNSDLASIKSKQTIPPQLVFTDDNQKELLRYVNLLLVPLLVLVIGGGVWYWRRKQMARVFPG